MRPGEVADLAGLSKQAVNDTLGELERAGYIERHPDPADGRARIVRLTERGRELQRAAHETSRTLERSWSESLGEERFAVLRETLQEMIAAGGTLPAPEAPAPPVTARR
jgi:DNA-binding MarR family transcriptional regulator